MNGTPAPPPRTDVWTPPAPPAPPAAFPAVRRPGKVAKVGGIAMACVGVFLVFGAGKGATDPMYAYVAWFVWVVEGLLGLGMVVGGIYLFYAGWQKGRGGANVLAILPGAAFALFMVGGMVISALDLNATTTASGASASATVSPSLGAERRWTGNDVAITLPASWVAMTDVHDLSSFAQLAGSDSATLRRQLKRQPTFAKRLRVAAYGDGEGLVLLAVPLDLAPGESFTQIANGVLAGMLADGSVDVVSRVDTTVDGHPGLEVEVQNTKALGRSLTYLWSDDTNFWLAIWSTGAGDFDAARSTYEAAMQTVHTTG